MLRRSALAHLADGFGGIDKFLEPIVLMLAHQRHAPRQRLTATSSDAAGNERVEDRAFVNSQAGHDRDIEVRK